MELAEPITYQQIQQMPYLVAVCKEAMRLLPSIVYQLLRYAPEGLSVNGKHIPAGVPVGVSPMAQNRDQEVFGADADEFRPERWFEDEQKTRLMDSINLTFGGNGPRMCIGRNIALVSETSTQTLDVVLTMCATRSKYTSSLLSCCEILTSGLLIQTSPGTSRHIGSHISTT